MCKENRILELGKIFVSRRILAELTTEKINEVISWHQNGCIIMLGNKDWIEKPATSAFRNCYEFLSSR